MTRGSVPSESELVEWAASGAMALTGQSGGPPSASPWLVATSMSGWARQLSAATSVWGARVELDGPALLGERAAISRFSRQGGVSVGGTAQFVPALDGWVVLNLPRPDDVAALPALVGADIDPSDWSTVQRMLAATSMAKIVERGSLLGLAVASTGEVIDEPPAFEFCVGGPRRVVADPLVVDLSSLWAGPLSTSLVLEAGARVVKVESRTRPDGARRGPSDFFDLLNSGKECVSVDLKQMADLSFLRRLLSAADLVVESSRPRAMANLGFEPAEFVASGTGWLSITGHGRSDSAGMRVGFGDDAAVAGGLWVDGARPCFVADAVADPMTGLCGGVLAAEMLGRGVAVGVDLALSRVAGSAASPAGDRSGASARQVAVADPRARISRGGSESVGERDGELRLEFE